ncbi:DNA cytosine methyltransferase [Delftia tsuruhatensis]|uniref:DNA cytosine methyltransferase n=1 Tax=Delftia tsuruhatensis TaxID=180282 RepID=UPI0020298D82|nr:DNA cytosine methyltransferase [Delftia tsuruhatensis]
MPAYYNEIDPYAAQWLRNLIAAGHIAPGVVDERSIEDVHPSDLRGFKQCHFFAGIGVWSLALRRAGWPDDRPVWTGSCPCQPFSAAGAGAGFDDERHLWPHFHWLIQERRPPTVFGEQVASRDADPWIDLVQDDLEGLGYGVAAVPFPSAGVGAPHIRDRLYWVAQSKSERRGWRQESHARGISDRKTAGRLKDFDESPGAGKAGVRLAHADQHGRTALPLDRRHDAQHHTEPCGELGRLGHADSERTRRDRRAVRGQIASQDGQHLPVNADAPGLDGQLGDAQRKGLALSQRIARIPCGASGASGADAGQAPERAGFHAPAGPGPTNGRWAAADWLLCRDGKWRPVEPGTFPLVDGAPSRVGRLRAYGNAINAQAAETFIRCVMPDL